jgi:CheY-like chemotaxis protein
LLIDDNIPDHQVQALVQSLDETRGLENVVVVLLGDIIKDFNEDNLADQQIDGFCIKPVSAAVLMSAFRPFLTKNTGEDLPLIVVKNRAKTDAQAVRPKGVSQVPVIAATSSASAGLAPAKQPQSSDAVGSLSSGPGNASSLEPFKCRILLVDDNEVNQVVGLGILEEVGLTADTACDGQEAIACLKVAAEEGAPYDLVLMDCQMPVMDGFTATENIRAGAAGPSVVEVPIIAMTANAMQGDREKCLAAGMTDYLAKPVEPDELVGALNKLLGCALSL